ncbi:MAG: hypothetical protein ACLQBX_01255 [Candidatus Limnocylindrales bacterium]
MVPAGAEDERSALAALAPSLPNGTTPVPLTVQERRDLLAMVALRTRVAKAGIAQRKAELVADFEAQLATEYSWDNDEIWRQAYAAATAAAEVAKRAITERCAELGIPEEFAPRISGPYWSSRNENATASRRVELRKVAVTRSDALAKQALASIESASLRAQEALLADGLTSGTARAFLAEIPTPAALMPRIELPAIEASRKVRP